jgi:hypothetical protein
MWSALFMWIVGWIYGTKQPRRSCSQGVGLFLSE